MMSVYSLLSIHCSLISFLGVTMQDLINRLKPAQELTDQLLVRL